jgi:Glycosyltransferase family 87
MEKLKPFRCVIALSLSTAVLIGWIMTVAPGFRWTPEKLSDGAYGNDFLQEWVGGKMVLLGEASQVYDRLAFDRTQHDPAITGFQWTRSTYYPPVYPPPHYLLAATIAWIPYRYATWLWMGFLGICLIATFVAFQAVRRNEEIKQSSRLFGWWCYALIPCFPPIYYSILMGQKGTLWMFLLAATWAFLSRGRSLSAGLVFGLVSIKPTLFFLLPIVLLRNGQSRFFVGASITTVAIWGSALVCLPWNVWSGFAEQLGMTSTYASVQGYHLDWSCNLISLAYAANLADIGFLKWMLVLPLCIYVLHLSLSERMIRLDSPGSLMKILLATMLLSPHAYFYDLAILGVPILLYASSNPVRSTVYTVGIIALIVTAKDVLAWTGIPIIPIALLGSLIEIHFSLRKTVSAHNCLRVDEGTRTPDIRNHNPTL